MALNHHPPTVVSLSASIFITTYGSQQTCSLGDTNTPKSNANPVLVYEGRSCKPNSEEQKFRGHPGLNRGPLDLQSNALPLSYTPRPFCVISWERASCAESDANGTLGARVSPADFF